MQDNRSDMNEEEYSQMMIIKYLSGDSNPEEELFVKELIGRDEAGRMVFEKLNHTWELTRKRNTLEQINVVD